MNRSNGPCLGSAFFALQALLIFSGSLEGKAALPVPKLTEFGFVRFIPDIFAEFCTVPMGGGGLLLPEVVRDGTEPGAWRDRHAKRYVREGLKPDIIKTLQDPLFFPFLESNAPELAPTFHRLLKQGLLADIRQSSYQIFSESRQCPDYTGAPRAGTASGERGGRICFATKPISDSMPRFCLESMRDAFVALALHEHAHHFGLLDADQSLYRFMARAIRGFKRMRNLLVLERRMVLEEFARARADFLREELAGLETVADGRNLNCAITFPTEVHSGMSLLPELAIARWKSIRITKDTVDSDLFVLERLEASPRFLMTELVSPDLRFSATNLPLGRTTMRLRLRILATEAVGEISAPELTPEEGGLPSAARPRESVIAYLRCR